MKLYTLNLMNKTVYSVSYEWLQNHWKSSDISLLDESYTVLREHAHAHAMHI